MVNHNTQTIEQGVIKPIAKEPETESQGKYDENQDGSNEA